ncbi:MAG: FAD-dependent oxidoreductase [Anaerolineae bacterium]|nr:FAD-dependent oxidoreductase [Anaerolineae bacterium]
MSNVIIIGAGYAGLTAAIELRRLLPMSDQVTVISANENFIFYPSLIWVVQGERDIADIAFPIRPILDPEGIAFVNAWLETIDPAARTVTLSNGQSLGFDKLLIATGGEWAWDSVPGLPPKPEGHTVSIFSPQAALAARSDWQALLADPGPIVIGAVLNAGLYGAAYEFALNLDMALRKAGLRDKVSITFVTPEPYLGHLGHDGLGNSRQILEAAFLHQNIMAVTEAQITQVEADAVVLGGRQARLPTQFTMLVPPYRGIKPVRAVANLGDERGRIPVDDFYRSQAYPDIYAAGVAVAIEPEPSLLPCDRLITGTVSAEMGRLAATNIVAELGHGQSVRKPATALKSFYVVDSGAHGVFMSLGPQSWLNVQLNIPGPWSHWAKVMAEKYQMWQIKTGHY